jgi:hypothetical protein
LSVFALSDIVPVVHAQGTTAGVSITPPTHVANLVGEIIIAYVNIYNVENLSAAKFTIAYNASTLQFLQIAQQTFFPLPPASSFQYTADGSLGFLQVNISLAGSQTPLSGNGTLVYVSFKVIQKPTSCTVSTIVFSQVSLLDSSATPIPCDSVGAAYFWGLVGPDPPGQGLLNEYTNKLGGSFTLGETVYLFSRVTYGADPVRNKLVAFQVLNPTDNTITVFVAVTDQNGIAQMSFRVPDTSSSLGVWTVFSTVELDQVAIWNVVYFQVQLITVGGYTFSPKVAAEAASPLTPYMILLVLSMLASIVFKSRKRKQR